MKIAMINASPKKTTSASAALLSDLSCYFSENVVCVDFHLSSPTLPENFMTELSGFDALVFAFPLYVDSVPSHLLSCLCEMEKAGSLRPETHVYGIANCGFFEGKQNRLALEILRHWCGKTGLIWGQGLGVGGGGALAETRALPAGKGPKASLGKALRALASHIESGISGETQYTSLDFPRFLYKFMAECGWRTSIKSNGCKTRDLSRRL